LKVVYPEDQARLIAFGAVMLSERLLVAWPPKE
jgi:hypothetical protein